ncbi:heme o synthase [Prochlorothrix hollandica]|uniref:Protoheme IX farnesyltransferase n=1 Tax=Prochlorothrix hollandica PCC 9006 = CALU 1027 TaxID=317619 RepID=A0A0M2Q1E9_PROHO|nr:heme o synthase [Prochlorothrix hollandica]KKJ01128.1 protoheme IX farnesyltransferase [Prochlorothrix hollandica PCC 9006 = CALU 1027]
MQNTLGNTIARPQQTPMQVVQSYYQLTKPRIILLLLITTASGMFVAAQGEVNSFLFIVTLVGGAMASGAANTINCLYDRDIDYIMERTRWRPLPSGRVQPRDALIFALVLTALSFTLLATFANVLAAGLAMAGIVFYVLIYTHWLKRHSTQNIVIGGAAGAIPPLVGWAAVTGDLSWAPWLMFIIIFLWTPPHFWALAMMIGDDYASVGVPMLPVIEGDEITAKQILVYSVLLCPVSLLLVYPLGVNGWLYGVSALFLGALLIQKSWILLQTPSDRAVARSLFKYSIFYMMLLSAAMVIDVLPVTHRVTQALLSLVA